MAAIDQSAIPPTADDPEVGAGAAPVRILAGTSGFSYKEWRGEFYPDKLPAKAMLEYYAGRLSTVEINNTFYRMPSPALLQGWRVQVPDTFRFAVKAPRRITHVKRLKDCGAELKLLLDALGALEPCLGSVLFQLPPYFKHDFAALSAFVAQLPQGYRAAFEFRNDSWLEPEVFALLAARNFALVQSESDATFEELPWTADWAYLRLRKVDYAEADLVAWLARLRASKVAQAQVFFKHEDKATGPKLAESFLTLAARG
jgi:uncharacterized protein YecE (DUF72 family)